MRLQKDIQFKEYQRLHSEKKKLEEKLDSYLPNTCVLMGDSFVNGVIERNLSNNRSVKVRKFPRTTADDLPHHVLPIMRKQPKYLIIHTGTNDAVKFTSRDILNTLLKSTIEETLPDAEIAISAPTLRSDNGKTALTVRQKTI